MAYRPETKFKTISESFQRWPSSPFVDASYKMDWRGNVVPRISDPTSGYARTKLGIDIVKQIAAGLEFVHEYLENSHTKEITDDVRDQLPFNEEYTVEIANGRSDSEQVIVHHGGAKPGYYSSKTPVVHFDIRGRSLSGKQPKEVIYRGPDGKLRRAPVVEGTKKAEQPGDTEKTFISKEPKGDVTIGPKESLPADSRMDTGYPGRRDPGGLA